MNPVEANQSLPARPLVTDTSLLNAVIELSPAFMAVLRGPAHKFELTNNAYRKLIGDREVVGMTVADALPEIESQGFIALLDKVYNTAEPYVGRGVVIYLKRQPDGPLEERYLDFVIQPVPGSDGKPAGIFVHGVDVTEQRHIEVNLRDSERQFRQLADAMPQIVFAATPDGHVDYFNKRWYEYTGTPEGEVGFESWKHVHTEAGLAHAMVLWPRALASGEPYEIEYPLRRHDGEYRWHLGRALPVRDETGRVVRWFGTNTDIDDLKRIEAQLAHSREQMKIVVQGANVGVWYCPLPFDKLIWDETVKGHFHLPPETEVTIEMFYDRIHPDDRAATKAAIERSITQRRGYDIDYRTVSADGNETKWIRATGRGFYDENGNPTRFDGITIDVTERVKSEIAIRESEERFRNMSDNAPVMIWVTRPDGYCEYLNKRWYDFTGQSEEEAHGLGWTKAVHPEDSERSGEAFMAANAVRGPFLIEYRLRRKDGEYRWCVDAASPRFGPNGEFLGYVGSVIDITDRALAEQERAILLEKERTARLEAERVSRMKDEFLATLSHELRTPLNAILGWSQILQGGSRDDEDLGQGLETIERNARAQSQIIDDLLDMSRIISGKVRLDVQGLDLASLVNAAVSTVRPTAENKSVRLRAVVDPMPGVSVLGDPGRMTQVLWNLLTNSLKFTPKGGTVQVVLKRINSHVELSVTDTGEGISADFLPFVFDRFRQADASTTRRHGGLGLGLSIVKQLVELHGGTVSAESGGPGRGSTFTVNLPLTAIQANAADLTEPSASVHPSDRSASIPPDMRVDLSGARILVVDDEPDARRLVSRLLTDCGAVTTLAGSVTEAMALIAGDGNGTGTPFDVVVSDIGMPGQDGYDLIHQLRALPREKGGQIPAVALTAYARAQDRIRALSAGFQMHVAKPVEPVELVTVVASAARRIK